MLKKDVLKHINSLKHVMNNWMASDLLYMIMDKEEKTSLGIKWHKS